MKSIFLPAFLSAFMFMPCILVAGTLENRDLNDYRYETFGPQGESLSTGIVYSQSTEYDFCDAGC